MKRRDILKYTALMTGAALSTPLILSLESCKSDSSLDGAPQKRYHFSEQQMSLLESMVDTILPKTDSPSASDVGVHYTIDQMVGQAYSPEDQKKYSSDFAKLEEYLLQETKGKKFSEFSESDRLQLLDALTKSENAQYSDAKNGLMALKQQTIAYYLNTEEIGTNYLNYLPVPGQYEGCITLESVGNKAWAL